ncbi:MAG: DUF5686 and carboxypeptidase regulatory-like domain-containing protein [Prevotellaceae bacterium]|jgi:hypothetical protein|nr:DUF5686 and carboxypeptidase regulatory-like domain-containing protein [Prevotellaceae bacterium]
MKFKELHIFFCFLILGISTLNAQNSVSAAGIVSDSLTNEPIAYASIVFEGTNVGTMSDGKGAFYIKNNAGRYLLTVSFLGYKTKNIILQKNSRNDDLKIMLVPDSYQLNEVVVKPKREKYSKKNNPAVDLIKNVIAHKNDNRIESRPQYGVEIYEKLTFSIDYFNFDIEKSKMLNRLSFLKNYIDTSELKGKPVLTLSVREKLSEYYYKKHPFSEKNITIARRHEGVDKPFDQNDLLSANLDEILKDINIFDNNIKFLLGDFVSPLSSALATTYYKYYILDTIDVAGEQCINLAFVPFNSESYGFTGQLYITLDGRFAVKKALLNTPKNINLNWVDQLRIIQEFTQLEDSVWALQTEHYFGNFYPMKGIQELYAHRLRQFSRYNFSPPQIDTIFNSAGKTLEMPDAAEKSDEFWLTRRTVPLSEKEANIGAMLNELGKKTGFNVFSKCLEILATGFIPTNFDSKKNKFDIGPNEALIGSNYVEGFRLRLGGMTTANLSKHWFLSGYAAFGFKDKKLKYQGKIAYSFNEKKYHENESPVRKISLMHGYDVYTPGYDFLSIYDNIFLLPVGQSTTQMLYIQRTKLQYEHEWLNNLLLKIWAEQRDNRPAGTLKYKQFDDFGNKKTVENFQISEVGFQLRFAPGESAYNSRKGKSSSLYLAKGAPVFKISHQIGIQGLIGGDFTYNHTEFSVNKRFWLSAFGFIDATFQAGKIWDKTPFPLLVLPRTSQSVFISSEAFMLMRPMEFITDEYAAFFATYHLKGFIFNRISLLKKLRLREVFTLKGMYGNLTDKNNPQKCAAGLFELPQETQFFGSTPYIEGSVGIENILNIVRIDYVRRLTYQNLPKTGKWGIRIAAQFSF